MEPFLTRIYTYLATYWLQVVAAIVIFFVGRWLAKVISNLLGRAMTKAKIDPTLTSFVKNLSHIALLAFVIIAAL
jgi:small conductance mechanosensitive channel